MAGEPCSVASMCPSGSAATTTMGMAPPAQAASTIRRTEVRPVASASASSTLSGTMTAATVMVASPVRRPAPRRPRRVSSRAAPPRPTVNGVPGARSKSAARWRSCPQQSGRTASPPIAGHLRSAQWLARRQGARPCAAHRGRRVLVRIRKHLRPVRDGRRLGRARGRVGWPGLGENDLPAAAGGPATAVPAPDHPTAAGRAPSSARCGWPVRWLARSQSGVGGANAAAARRWPGSSARHAGRVCPGAASGAGPSASDAESRGRRRRRCRRRPPRSASSRGTPGTRKRSSPNQPSTSAKPRNIATGRAGGSHGPAHAAEQPVQPPATDGQRRAGPG